MLPGKAQETLSAADAALPSMEQIWEWLSEVADPEIPAISVVDLGIVRGVRRGKDGVGVVVTVTPTYSGCPATSVIAADIAAALQRHGIDPVRIETQLAPPWTTDWMSELGKERLRQYGIAPPQSTRAEGIPLKWMTTPSLSVKCPLCGSANTEKLSEFGSTPCKSQRRCRDCLEPFDHFKCI